MVTAGPIGPDRPVHYELVWAGLGCQATLISGWSAVSATARNPLRNGEIKRGGRRRREKNMVACDSLRLQVAAHGGKKEDKEI